MVGAPPSGEVEREPDSDGEAPEEVSLSAGREDAQKLRRVERGNQRRVQAEAKQRRQRTNFENKSEILPQEREGVADAQLPNANAASFTNQDEGSEFPKSARNSGFLDASIVDFLSAREKNVSNSLPLPQVDDFVKEKRARKRKKIQHVEPTTSRITTRLLDANRPSVANVKSALDFKRNRLYGRRVHRSLDMLPKS